MPVAYSAALAAGGGLTPTITGWLSTTMPVACSATLAAGDGLGIKAHRLSGGPQAHGRMPVTRAKACGYMQATSTRTWATKPISPVSANRSRSTAMPICSRMKKPN